ADGRQRPADRRPRRVDHARRAPLPGRRRGRAPGPAGRARAVACARTCGVRARARTRSRVHRGVRRAPRRPRPARGAAAPGLGGELKPCQRAGVAYLLDRRRAFLADEQGLGKTIQALAAIEADAAFPAVVVCPASLKLNWARELGRWLPHRRVRALDGVRPRPAPAGGADVTVVNYDIVAARLGELVAPVPRALVLDESHYCKNQPAQRT